MEWNIVPYVGMGPIKFGMNPDEVSEILGPSKSVTTRGVTLRELRAIDMPMIRYRDNKVTEIEAFNKVKNVILDDVNIFDDDGRRILRALETKNNGAKIYVGAVMFETLGVTTGRLDEDVASGHSITAFCKGHWNKHLEKFEKISFE